MARSPGWTKVAAAALEIAALASASFAMELAAPEPPPKPARDSLPPDFLTEGADEGANFYRAADGKVELVAGLYSDGRIRLADEKGRKFAGALIGGHADLLELRNNNWSEVFLRVTPTGRMQLELRGGPYDAHVLTCESLRT